MPLPKNITDSHSPFVSEFTFSDGQRTKGIVPQEYLQSLEVELSGNAGWKGQVVFFDKLGGELEELLINAGATRHLDFRFGWDNTGGLTRQPMLNTHIVKYSPLFAPEGVTLTMDFVNRALANLVTDKVARTFPENLTPTAIFMRIATERGWRTTDEFGNLTVEPSASKAKISTPMSTDGESDIKFIMDHLLKLAHNEEGQGFLFFFDRDGSAHFHSRDFMLLNGTRSKQIAAEYIFARDGMGEVISFEPTDDTFGTLLTGGGVSEANSVDSLKGVATREVSDALRGPEGVTNSLKNGASSTPKKPKGIHERTPIVCRTPEELQARLKSRWTILQSTSYKAELVVRGTHAIRLFDYIDVKYLKRDGLPHYLSGTFSVHAAKHIVDSGGWRTQFTLAREGSLKIDGADKMEGKEVEVGRGVSTQVLPNVQEPNSGGIAQTNVKINQGTDVSRRFLPPLGF